MRRALLALSALACLPAAAFAATLGVPMDQSVRLALTGSVHDVIVGNPAVADVTVDDDHHLIVTGKKPGTTNLIVTDQRGRTIFDRQLVVNQGGGAAGDSVTLIAGLTTTTYACAPTCETAAGPSQNYGAAVPAAAPPPAGSFTITPTTPAAPVAAAPAPGVAGIQASPTVP